MKTCAIPCCRNTTSERPDLSYFSLPRLASVREEWLDVLDLKRRDSSQKLMVCELHFRSKDFCESKKNSRGSNGNKKELKHHAVPVLRINACKIEAEDSEDEFMQCGSGDEPEILEVTQINSPVVKNIPDIKEEKIEIKEEPTIDVDTEPIGRRSSRRAALVAAKKIFNTVRNYGIKDEPGDPVATSSSPKTVASPRPYTRPRKKETPVHVDLVMECKDDELSPAQAQSLVKAQLQYNMVMRNLRELTALNVRVIQTEPPAPSNGTIKNGNSAPKALKPKTPIPVVRTPAVPSATQIILV